MTDEGTDGHGRGRKDSLLENLVSAAIWSRSFGLYLGRRRGRKKG